MRRFYFHLRHDGELLHDDEGLELLDAAAARREAEQAARELLAEAIKTRKETVPEAFVIADEHGRAVDIVLLVTALARPFKT